VPAFLLTWNPRRWPVADRDYEAWRASTLRGEPVVGRWSTGRNRRRISAGDVLYWLRQGPDRRGVVGSGRAVGEVFQDVHYDDPARVANYVEHGWDVLVPVDDRLPTEELLHVVPRVPWNFLQGSGYQVPAHSEALLARTWAEHLEALDPRTIPTRT
jgi:hypothetical protein